MTSDQRTLAGAALIMVMVGGATFAWRPTAPAPPAPAPTPAPVIETVAPASAAQPSLAKPKPKAVPALAKPKPIMAPERKTKREKKRDKKKAATPQRQVAAKATTDCRRARRARDKIMALPRLQRLPAGLKRMAETGVSWSEVNETRRICGI